MAYKVIYRIDATPASTRPITWKPGCPLAFEALQVSRDVDTGAAFLQARIRNVSDQQVSSFQAAFTIRFEDGSEEHRELHPLDADMAPGADRDITPIELSRGDVSSASGAIQSARTPDGTWKSAGPDAATPLPELPTLDDLDEKQLRERFLSLRELTFGKAPEGSEHRRVFVGDGWWRCVCGQVNQGRQELAAGCCNCHARFKRLQELEDPQVLATRISERAVRDERARQQAEEDKRAREASAKKRRRFAAISAAVAAVLLIGCFALSTLLADHSVWVISKVVRHGTETTTETTYEYDENGKLKRSVDSDPDDGSDDGGSVTTYETDDFGMPVKATKEDGSTITYQVVDKDSSGRPLKVEMTSSSDKKGADPTVWTYTYRADGALESRATKSSSSSGSVTSDTVYDEDGLPESNTITFEFSSKYLDDSQYRSTYTVDHPDGHAATITSKRVVYEDDVYSSSDTNRYTIDYDGNGNVSKITDKSDGTSTEYSWTKLSTASEWVKLLSKVIVEGRYF